MSLQEKMNKAAAPTTWSKPEHFKLDGTDDDRFEALLDQGDITVHDPIDQIAEDLFELEYPHLKDNDDAKAEYVKEFAADGTSYGEWVHLPWDRKVVRYPEEADHYNMRTFRNQHLVTVEEQAAMRFKTIAAFGMSVGSNIVDQLVQSGVGDRYVIGDFDTLAPSNLNRIRSNMAHVGMRKIDIMGQKISEVDPYIKQVHLPTGFDMETPAVLDEHRPDLIVEEIDDVSIKARIRQYAKEHGIPLVMAADLAEMSLLHVERHDLEDVRPFNGRLTQGEFDRLLEGDLSASEKLGINVKILGARNALASARFIDSNMEIGKRLAGIPQLGSIATAGAALTDRSVREILVGRRMPSGVYMQSAEKALGTQRVSTRREHAQSVLNFLKARKAS